MRSDDRVTRWERFHIMGMANFLATRSISTGGGRGTKLDRAARHRARERVAAANRAADRNRAGAPAERPASLATTASTPDAARANDGDPDLAPRSDSRPRSPSVPRLPGPPLPAVVGVRPADSNDDPAGSRTRAS